MEQGETIGQKLSRLSVSFSPEKKSQITPPNRDDYLFATHPSDHNAVHVDGITHKAREKRNHKTRKRKDRELKKLKRGETDNEVYERSQQHGLAFLVPVPLYYGYGCPSGVPCGPDGACAAVSVRLPDRALQFLTVVVQGGCGGGVSGGGCTPRGGGCGGAGCGSNTNGGGGCGGGGGFLCGLVVGGRLGEYSVLRRCSYSLNYSQDR